VPTPTEPNEPNELNEPHNNTHDVVPSTRQPRDVVPERMPTPDHPDEATDEAVTEAVEQGPTLTQASSTGRPPRTPFQRRRVDRVTGTVHLFFGAVEDLLADLTVHGAPDDRVVRVERLVRTRPHTMGGVATLGIAVTARRADEVLSCWVIVARLELDPWGWPLSTEAGRKSAVRHRDAQRLIGALAADAGFDVRLGLYQLPEDCYGFAATCDALHTLHDQPYGVEQVPADRGGGTGDQEEREEQEDEGETEGGGRDA
jgi:hypothetical protein